MYDALQNTQRDIGTDISKNIYSNFQIIDFLSNQKQTNNHNNNKSNS